METENKKSVTEKKKEVVEKTQKEIGNVIEKVVKATEEKKPEDKVSEKKDSSKEKVKKEISRKIEAKVSVSNIPMSTKHSMALCDFIRNKKIGDAIRDVEQVIAMKKAVPMKGEIPHRKGKGMMSGRFPQNASQNFLKLLKSLASNSVYNGIESPVIVEAVANIGARPYGKFGQVRRKRTHVLIKAREEKR